MSIIILSAGGQAAAESFGFVNAMKEGGALTIATASILGIMLFVTLYILLTKLYEQQKIINQGRRVRSTFWSANSLREGAAKLEKDTAYKQIVDDGIAAHEQHGRLTDPVEAHDWVRGSLGRSEGAINSQLGGGLAFLATVGSTAPFIGLFGTVVGILNALIRIAQAGDASITKVAGPVGEALIMTAFGLVVAVPAVLAFNFLQRRNKSIAEHLNAFSNDVLGYIASEGAVRPVVARSGKSGSGPAPKPAATTTTAGQAGGVQTRA